MRMDHEYGYVQLDELVYELTDNTPQTSSSLL